MPKDLPKKYYLAHARELFSTIGNNSAHLLETTHKQLLENFYSLDEDSQSLVIRFLTRKPIFLARDSLVYDDIIDPSSCINNLTTRGFLRTVNCSEWQQFVLSLNKSDLLNCLNSATAKVKASTTKAKLVEMAQTRFKGNEANLYPLRDRFLVLVDKQSFEYLLFLYFGGLSNRLQEFVMRDLGVLKTRKKTQFNSARFSSVLEARNAFKLHLLLRESRTAVEDSYLEFAQRLLRNKPISEHAVSIWDKLILEHGLKLVDLHPDKAVSLWQESEHPKCIERWVRQRQRMEGINFKQPLEQLRGKNHKAETQIFLEDFYSRKYLGKRTTVFTDILTASDCVSNIDESYLGNVEQGVINKYRREGVDSFFSENVLWKTLFALFFWELLFNKEAQAHNEFDFLPAALTNKNFYQLHQQSIEKSLSRLADPQQLLMHFTSLATANYGLPTGMFKWNNTFLEPVSACLLHSPPEAIGNVLREIAKDYHNRKDGYPDLMVIKDNAVYFEEVKSPGDSLRANQLVSINRLRTAGFEVRLNQVHWFTDPQQRYAVVDIETTGMRKGGANAITEIAVVVIQNSKVVEEWSSLLNPQRPIPNFITRLTGISNQMVERAPLFQEVADTLEKILTDSIFVAHNVGFDYGFIRDAFAQMNRPFEKTKYCTVVNSRKTFPGLKSYSLGKLANHFELVLNNAHRALDDARATADLLLLIQAAQLEKTKQKTQTI